MKCEEFAKDPVSNEYSCRTMLLLPLLLSLEFTSSRIIEQVQFPTATDTPSLVPGCLGRVAPPHPAYKVVFVIARLFSDILSL